MNINKDSILVGAYIQALCQDSASNTCDPKVFSSRGMRAPAKDSVVIVLT